MVSNLAVRGINERRTIDLPPALTISSIPDTKYQVPTSEVLQAYEHTAKFAHKFCRLDPKAEVLVLIGNDCGDGMGTRCYGNRAPWVHHTTLGWALVGRGACAPPATAADTHNVMRASVVLEHEHLEVTSCHPKVMCPKPSKHLTDVFQEYTDDDSIGLSRNDEKFLDIMSSNLKVNSDGNLEMPLPFKEEDFQFPSNREKHSNAFSDNLDELPESIIEGTVLKVDKQIFESSFTDIYSRTNQFQKATNIVAIKLKMLHLLDKARQRLGISLAPRPFRVPYVTVKEYMIRDAQNCVYYNEICSLKRSKALAESHEMSPLAPFIDGVGILRVGGRIKNSSVAFDSKHPAFLPSNCSLSRMILDHFHQKVCHRGRHITHGAIRQAGFHIDKGRAAVKDLIKNCIKCHKFRAPLCTQKMADLPRDRLEEVPPFQNVGLDVFGHFLIHDGKNTRQSKATKKVWTLIIVCAVSRAVHIEMLPHMDTVSFRNALFRFLAIRGDCKLIRSDRGSNFMSARKQMSMKEFIDVDQIQKELLNRDCEWLINPPGASHFAGFIERKIGSIRRVLESTIQLAGNKNLSRDELTTFMQQAASIVNNTPLWSVSDCPNDPCPLSPAMLLTLREKPNVTDSFNNFTEEDMNAYGIRRWRRVQYLASQFWVRWRRDYLQTLQKRNKWRNTKNCVRVDDIVLVKDKKVRRNEWPLGRIIKVYTSSDGLVRSVRLALKPLKEKGPVREFDRAVTDLVLLVPAEKPSA